jgi:hypothetical protein
VAELSYKFSKKNEKQFGKAAFYSGVGLLFLIVALYFVFAPPDFYPCDKQNPNNCTCPSDVSNLGERSIILIDTTDPLRDGKYEDVKRILQEFVQSRKSILEWIKDGKKVNKVTIYLLADKSPADMRPIGSFCQLPPEAALIASSKTAAEIRQIESDQLRNIVDTAERVKGPSSAASSPILETIATITSNSSSWTPGGDLIIISDMIQNSEICGWFNSMQNIPPFSKTSKECKHYADLITEHIKPSSVYSKTSAIAVCTLLRQSLKPGLKSFWTEVFQENLGYDILWSCDPKEVFARHAELNRK